MASVIAMTYTPYRPNQPGRNLATMGEGDDRAGIRLGRPEVEADMALKIRVYSDYV